MSLLMAWLKRRPQAPLTVTVLGTRPVGRPASHTSPEGYQRVDPGAQPSRFLPMCAQSEGAAPQGAQASAEGRYAGFGSPWLGAITSCFQATPRPGPSYLTV